MARLDRRNHETISEPRVERPVCRLQVELQATLVAPALQFEHPVALPHRVTLLERQSAGLGKQIDQHHRLVVHRHTVSR